MDLITKGELLEIIFRKNEERELVNPRMIFLQNLTFFDFMSIIIR